jgi:hypothetical protein
MDKPLKKTGVPDGARLQPKSAAATSYLHPLLTSPTFVRDRGTQTDGCPLSLEFSVQQVQTSPTIPQLEVDLSSPVSIVPQSGNTSPDSTTVPKRERPAGRNDLPTYESAFEFALRPFLNAIDDTHEQQLCLPAPAQPTDSIRDTTPLVVSNQQPLSTGYESHEEEEYIPEYGIPESLMQKYAFRTRMRHFQLRTLLMHCTVLQATASDIERTPWRTDNKHSADWYYEKIRSLAYKAKPLAEALESNDLQARCEYWAGRGCSGTRDYQAAEAHFELALKLDVPNDTTPKGKARFRGLLPTEKADVRFLRDSCSARHIAWQKRTTRAMKIAERQAEEMGVPLEACLEENMVPSPPWMPDRDRVVQLATQAFGNQGITDEEANSKDLQVTDRMMLNKKEWQYIKHGDVQMAEQRARQRSAEQKQALYDTSTSLDTSRKRSTIKSTKTSRLASDTTEGSAKSHPYRQSLANELEGLETVEWETSPTASPSESQGPPYELDQWSPTRPRHVDQDTPKPTGVIETAKDDTSIASAFPTNLKHRRHIELDPIITEGFQAQPMVADTVRSLSPMSQNLNTAAEPTEKQTSSSALGQRPNPNTLRQTSLPVPPPLQSAPLQPAKRISFLLPPTTRARTKSFNSVASEPRPPLASATRSRPMTASDDPWTGHRRVSPFNGPLNGFPWSYGSGMGNHSPTTPNTPASPMVMPV